jgi:hypothetical protein
MSYKAVDDGSGYGVRGESGVAGDFGVVGQSSNGPGTGGYSGTWHGVYGESHSTTGGCGVFGASDTGDAVRGEASGDSKAGVIGFSTNHTANAGPGVYGESDAVGVYGVSHTWHGVHGETTSTTGGAGVHGKGPTAGYFEGNVAVTGNMDVSGDVRLLNADCAEEFDIAQTEGVDPGTVMVLTGGGALCPSQQAYDKRVAGIVSGAGDYQPALILDRQQNDRHRLPIALMGKVYCKVDAQYGPVEIGDLLTTSPTPGHAMRVADPARAFGSVIGKALRPLEGGQGLIPVLVALQ